MHPNQNDCSNTTVKKQKEGPTSRWSRLVTLAADLQRSGMFGKIVEERSFLLDKKVDKLTVAITYWTDMQTKKVIFSVKASLGL